MEFEEGIHYGVRDEEYFAIPAASASRLSLLKRSPAHMKAAELHPRDSKAFRLGTLIHQAVLEPNLFESMGYVRGPEGDRRTKAVKAAWAQMFEEHGDDAVLKPDEYDTIMEVNRAMVAHSGARDLIDRKGHSEVTIMWRDPETRVPCKGRIDFLPDDLDTIVDVKSTQNADPHAFSKSYYQYRYYGQMAFYLEGLTNLGEARSGATIIAVEKTPPNCIVTFRCDEGSLDAGSEENRRLLHKYAECLETGAWPGYTQDIVDLSIPSYGFYNIDEYLNG